MYMVASHHLCSFLVCSSQEVHVKVASLQSKRLVASSIECMVPIHMPM